MSMQNKRDDSHLSVSHLGGNFVEEENWDTTENENLVTDDEELEKELLDNDEEDEEFDDDDEDFDDDEEEPAPVNSEAAVDHPMLTVNPEEALRQIEALQSNLPALEAAMVAKLAEISTKRQQLDAEEKDLKSRMNLIRVLGGGATLPEQDGPRRRGRKPGSTNRPQEFDENGEPIVRGRGGRGKRFKNSMTMKEAIVKALFRMIHPTKGTQYTGFVNDITLKVTQEEGYKTTSDKPTNTVRIQLYRLADEEKVTQNNDNSYTLTEETVQELKKAEELAKENTSTEVTSAAAETATVS